MQNITERAEKVIKETVSDVVARVLEEGFAETLSRALVDSGLCKLVSTPALALVVMCNQKMTKTEMPLRQSNLKGLREVDD